MLRDRLYSRGIRRRWFWIRKIRYAWHALIVILLLSREDLQDKFWKGYGDNGSMTADEFLLLNSDAEFKDEMIDGYWYHLWGLEQGRIGYMRITQKKDATL